MAGDSTGGWLALGLLGLAIYSCSGNEEREADQQYIVDALGVSEDQAEDLLDSYGNADDVIEDYREIYREPFDEEEAGQTAEEELASEGYDYSYGCTSDCSGHEAGWQWRAENGYATPGYSNSFDEGGRAFDDALEERIDEMRQSYEDGEEPY